MSTSQIKIPDFAPHILDLLDFCKGIAICWVFLFHYQKGWFGWQGVHVFIVLSGFGLAYSCLKRNQNFVGRQWYLRRLERIIPAYWLVVTTVFLLMLILDWTMGKEVSFNFSELTIQFTLDLLLLRNFSYETMFGYPNASLWFVPLIVSFYFIFPWLYNRIYSLTTIKNYLLFLLVIAAIEFLYRAIAIYFLDGFPVSYGKGFLWIFPMSVTPLDRLKDDFLFPFQFQLWAPFGLFPSRIAEFTLGMIGAKALLNNQDKFRDCFFNYKSTAAGITIWLLGNLLLYVGRWGWIFSDFIISLGLVIWIVNLASVVQRRFPYIFIYLSKVGTWSYYIFLTHLIFMYIFLYPFMGIDKQLAAASNFFAPFIIQLSTFVCTILITGSASWLLMQLDNSGFSRLLVQGSIAKILKP